MAYTYEAIKQAILNSCAKVNITYAKDGDGRLTSAVKEKEYLTQLEQKLKADHPTLVFEHQPVERWWWDFRVNTIPINLKLTTGGTDNAFNKTSVLYTLTGQEDRKNMNFSEYYMKLKTLPKKTERNYFTEYHYLAVSKETGQILLKSLLDIHTYKTNPCNNIQINWKHEFKNAEYIAPSLKLKVQQLVKAIQACVKQDIESKKMFADANVEEDFSM